MVSTCVDSALDELDELVRDSSLSIPMKRQIKNLQLELRFLKTFFWCLARCGEAVEDVLMESDMGGIKATLSRAGQGLYAAGSCAIDGVGTERWDLISENLLKKVEQIKPQMNRICLDLLDQSLQCTYSTSREIMEFIGAILKNLKDGLNHRPNMQKQIRDFEEMLDFLRNFVSVTKRGVIKYDKFQDFLNHVQTCANNAACVLFLYWSGDQMNEATALRMSNVLSDPLQKIKPFASDFTGMYLGVLKASEPASSDPVMTSEVVARFVDFLLQDLPVSMKDYIRILSEGLMFLITFLVHPPSGTKKGQHLFAEADAVLCNIASFICSLVIDRTNECASEVRHSVLLDFLTRVDIIKVKVKELYVEISDLSLLEFPKTNGLGFINFFVENLNEMLERKAFLKPFEKEKIAAIQKELVLLRCFLKDSFELRNEEMEMRILKATYKAEHVIDCVIHSPIWYRMICLSDVKEEIKNIKTDIKRMEDEHKYKIADQMNISHSVPAQDKVSTFSHNADVVGLDDETIKVMDLLVGESRELQIVSIVGMAGVGKTTLANEVYNHDSIKLHFHKRAWCSVSPTFRSRSRELLLAILECLDSIDDRIRDMIEEDLADLLRKHLLGFCYLIVIDDIWEIAAWNEIRDSFPNGDQRSRILFTSRIHNLALQTQLPFSLHHCDPLSGCKSWELFRAKLILNGECSSRILEVGKEIVKKCNGLPLAIVIAAGLLSRIDKNLDLLKRIDKNLSSFMDGKEGYKEVLELSYKYLPDHLKPFFLYFGAFQEDKAISVQKLIQIWVAEGFVPKRKEANVEDVAKDYLKDLTARSLVIVTNRGSNGEIKACRMHNLLRELCLAKVKQESFMKLLDISPSSTNAIKHQQYRLCIYPEWWPFVMSKPIGPNVRSLLFSSRDNCLEEHPCDSRFFISFKLLRVLNLESIYLDGSFPLDIIRLAHLRYLAIRGDISEVPSSIEKLWNLETFVLKGSRHRTHLPHTIWNMRSLRHVDVSNVYFSEFELEESTELDVETFGTLKVSYGEEAKELLRRLPKVRKLRCLLSESRNSPRNCNQVLSLHFPGKLKSLNVLHIGKALNLSTMVFPETLEKLTLSKCGIPWNQISTLAKLPNLQILKLQSGAFVGETWDLDDNEFPKLKFLKLFKLDIAELNASSDAFPNLERLVVERCSRLLEIPSTLEDIDTLNTIEVRWCRDSVAASAGELLKNRSHLDLLVVSSI